MKKLILFVILSLSTVLVGQTNSKVEIKTKQVNNNLIVEAKNRYLFSVTLYYDATYKNLDSNQKLPAVFVLKPNSTKEILKLKIKGKASYKGHAKWIMGSVYAKHNDNYIYGLPYKQGSKRKVSQGFNGKFSHNSISSRYAVDFPMPEGTQVHAARNGVVVLTENVYFKHGITKDFATKGNVVIIEHDDGTFGMYAHLYRFGVHVREGQHVKKGEFIAQSGNTGFSTGPHLHFNVYKVQDAKKLMKSLPIKFMSKEGLVNQPIKGEWYTAK